MVVVTHRHHAAPGFYRDTVLAKAKARNTARGFRPVGVSPGYISTGYGLHAPQRHFGTRLGPGYTNTISARDTYGDYSSSYLPPVGRDSYSAYRASDAAIDLEDDLVSRSRRRDAELLYGVNGELNSMPPSTKDRMRSRLDNMKWLARHGSVPRATSVPPVLTTTRTVRASSVPPQTVTQTLARRPVKGVILLYDEPVVVPPIRAASVPPQPITPDLSIVPRALRSVMPSVDLRIARAHANARKARCGNSSNWPALLSYRSSSVPNMSMIGLSGPPVSASRRQVTRRTYGAKNSAPGIGRYRQMVSVCPPPRVPTTYTTVKSGADLLLPYPLPPVHIPKRFRSRFLKNPIS